MKIPSLLFTLFPIFTLSIASDALSLDTVTLQAKVLNVCNGRGIKGAAVGIYDKPTGQLLAYAYTDSKGNAKTQPGTITAGHDIEFSAGYFYKDVLQIDELITIKNPSAGNHKKTFYLTTSNTRCP